MLFFLFLFFFFFFFFQAEDGIRDIGVTGVQTCALPILGGAVEDRVAGHFDRALEGDRAEGLALEVVEVLAADREVGRAVEIGRASCRERGKIWVGEEKLKEKKKERNIEKVEERTRMKE